MEGAELEIEEDPAEAFEEGQMKEQGAEGLEEEVQPKEYPAEASGEGQTEEHSTEGDGASENPAGVLSEVLTKAEFGKAQRYDKDLASIRVKAERAENPYFWQGGLLMRKPYKTLGKSLLIIPTIARQKVLTMAHNSPLVDTLGRNVHYRVLGREWIGWEWSGMLTRCVHHVRPVRRLAQLALLRPRYTHYQS